MISTQELLSLLDNFAHVSAEPKLRAAVMALARDRDELLDRLAALLQELERLQEKRERPENKFDIGPAAKFTKGEK